MDWAQCGAVDRDAARVGGAWCFRGTRLPVESLFEHLDKGATVDEFLEWFPWVGREQVHQVLNFAMSSLHQLPLSQAHEVELERRLVSLDQDRREGVTWAALKAELEQRETERG